MTGIILNNISDCYIGNNQVKEIWYSSNKIWPSQPVNPYESQYFTIEITQAGDLYLKSYTSSTTEPTLISYDYSLNNGAWQTVTETKIYLLGSELRYQTSVSFGSFSVGDKIRIRHTGSINDSIYKRRFEGTAYFKVYGNIMSLLYGNSFIGKRSLISTYEFSALFWNSTSQQSYTHLDDCENLVLPATTLTQGCYSSMFEWCESITTAPILPATILVADCYSNMFDGCNSLNYVKCYATDISATNCLNRWLNNVSSTGTFYKDSNTTYSSDAHGIPEYWTIEDIQ